MNRRRTATQVAKHHNRVLRAPRDGSWSVIEAGTKTIRVGASGNMCPTGVVADYHRYDVSFSKKTVTSHRGSGSPLGGSIGTIPYRCARKMALAEQLLTENGTRHELGLGDPK